MRSPMKPSLLVLFLLALTTSSAVFMRTEVGYTVVRTMLGAGAALTDAFGGTPVTLSKIWQDYIPSPTQPQKKLRILLVPGHEPSSGGTAFRGVYERNLTAELGGDLQTYLVQDQQIQTFTTRTADTWTDTFAQYFNEHWQEIITWHQQAKTIAEALTAVNDSRPPKVYHTSVDVETATRLYGITKWANENNIDLMLHIHFNDYPRRRNTMGTYSGFVLYIPSEEYANNPTTKALVEALFARLAQYNPVTDHEDEAEGIVDDSELIATGAHNTADAASILIEYGYIYEAQFQNPELRSLALRDLAYQTHIGLQDFFSHNTDVTPAGGYTPSEVYRWTTPVVDAQSDAKDIYAMQTALIMDGMYPPSGKSFNECPHTGNFGPCTKVALAAFQKKYGLPTEGPSGTKTFAQLQKIYNKLDYSPSSL